MPPFIEVNGLTKRFKNHTVIDGLTLSIAEREIVIFQGPSGVGKSTFLRCLTYLEPFQEGEVRVGAHSLTPGMDERRHHDLIQNVRQDMGFVFQFFNLFPHLTVLDNMTLAPVKVLKRPLEEARARAMELLKRVGLEAKAHIHPTALSGGQQQRVGIVRALAMRPKVMLFDEPTSSLDPAMKREIVDVMEDFAQDGLTMLIVTHEPSWIEKIATRFIEFGPQCSIVSDRNR